MKAKISFDVMVNEGRIFYGTVVSDIVTHNKIISDKDLNELVFKKFPTLKHRQFNIEINYVHYSTD